MMVSSLEALCGEGRRGVHYYEAVQLFMETVVKTISNHVKKLPKCIAYRTNRECEYFVKKGQAESNRMRGLTGLGKSCVDRQIEHFVHNLGSLAAMEMDCTSALACGTGIVALFS